MGTYSILVSLSSKKTSTNNSSKTISAINIPIIPAVNVDLFPDVHWNDHVAGKNTLYDLEKRVLTIGYNDPEGENDIIVEIDRKTFTQNDYNIIENLSAIIQDSGEPGVFQLGNLKITIVSVTDHTNELIICK
jgi:hypothetical protein